MTLHEIESLPAAYPSPGFEEQGVVSLSAARRCECRVKGVSKRHGVQVMEEKVTDVNVDIATIAPKYHLFTQQQVAEVLGRV